MKKYIDRRVGIDDKRWNKLKEAEKVVSWLFTKYQEHDYTKTSAKQMQAQSEGLDMDHTPGKDDGEPPVSYERLHVAAGSTRENFQTEVKDKDGVKIPF